MTTMRYFIIMILGVWLNVAYAQGQEVGFVSTNVEEGVRQHLGLAEDAPISFAQLDTITTIDLSHRGITDVRDIVLMPNLRMLDLSDNRVEDLQPIAVLDSLEWVDLSYNNLRGINDLFYSSTKKLTVNVAFNHIRDFSLFGSMSSCSFVLEGVGLQYDENAPYFDVYDFYADVDDEDNPLVCYRGITNMEAAASLMCGSLDAKAQMDGYTNSVLLPGNLAATTQAILSNGEKGDTTWVVPSTRYQVASGQALTIDTELPSSYQIGYLRALHGTVSADGTQLQYVAPSPAVVDTLYLSYHENECVKGFTQLYINGEQTATEVKSISGNPPLQMSLHGHLLRIEGNAELSKEVKEVRVFDSIGRMLAMQTPDNGETIDIQLPTKQTVVIVELIIGQQHVVSKVAVK